MYFNYLYFNYFTTLVVSRIQFKKNRCILSMLTVYVVLSQEIYIF